MKIEDPKNTARGLLKVAIDNFKQAELEGAEVLAPVTYRWAKTKIYDSKKIILSPNSSQLTKQVAVDDASAASAQLLSAIHRQASKHDLDFSMTQELFEKEAISILDNEGGPVA